jgi:hypothetical protein
MPVTPDPNQLLLGRGTLYFDRFDVNGLPQGLRFVGEVDKLEINPTSTTKDYFTMTKAASTKIAQNITQQVHEFDLQFREYNADNLAIALIGDKITLTQGATVVAAGVEQLTAKALPGYIYQTANRMISAVTAKTGATALVAGTDYEVLDATLGLIHVLPGTVTLDGTLPLSVGYTAAAIANGTQIQGGTQSKIEGKLVFIGDPANGPVYDAEIWRVRFQPSGALALITDDYSVIPLKAEAMDDSANHPTQPLYRVTKR